MYPCIKIKFDGIIHNLRILKDMCTEHGISLSVVTKLLAGNEHLVRSVVEKGKIATICDSRIENFKRFADINVEKWLIRSPMLAEVKDTVEFCDVSFNTEMETIKALNAEAKRRGKRHKIILMCESGDLREGCYIDELVEIVGKCLRLSGIKIYGIGTNMSCVNAVLPSVQNMARFETAVNSVKAEYGIKLPIISGGASSSIKMLCEDTLPGIVNNLRMGEAIFLGNIPVFEEVFYGARTDNFLLEAEIIELKNKPSIPNTLPEKNDKMTKRAIVALGKQEVYLPGLICVDSRLKIVGGSSDHIVLEVSDGAVNYRVGSIVEFKMTYNCLLNVMSSRYVEKILV